MDRRVRSWCLRVVAVALLAAAPLVLPAREASAHAELVETNPSNGAHLDRPPPEVVLRFSEAVTPVRGGLWLLDGTGRMVAGLTGNASPAGASQVSAPLPGTLGDGVYVVTWRVMSDDSHPVHGSFVFSVGAAQAAPLADPGARAGADPAVGVAFWLARLVGFAGLALLVGGAFFIAACWPAGGAQPRARRLLAAAWIVCVASSVGVLLLQGPNAAGSSLVAALDPALLLDTLRTRFGVVLLARIALLLLAGPVLARSARAAGPPVSARGLVAVAMLGFALVLTWPATGHAAAGPWPAAALLTDAVHLVAMSVWLGGLAVLAACLLRGHGHSGHPGAGEAVAAVSRFSRSAGVAVAVLAATGVVQAWRELAASGVGGRYASLLAFKVAAFGLLLWLGALSRSVVRRQVPAPAQTTPASARAAARTPPRTAAPPTARASARASARTPPRTAARGSPRASARALAGRGEPDLFPMLRRSVRWEVAIAAVVLGLTAMLVATPPGGHDHGPASAASTAAGPFLGALPLAGAGPGAGDVQVWVDPARPGANQIVLNVRDESGINRDVPEVRAQLRMVEGDIGPQPVPLVKRGPGRYVADSVVVPVAGVWRLSLSVRTTDHDETTVEAEIPMRP